MKNKKYIRNGHPFNSKYWQDWKKTLPIIDNSSVLFQVILGIVLSDATMYRTSREAIVKFEQGVDQKEFIFHLFDVCKQYCFITEPGIRYHIRGPKKGQVKSYWFKTFSHKSFTIIWDMFYFDTKKSKSVSNDVIQSLNEVGLSY